MAKTLYIRADRYMCIAYLYLPFNMGEMGSFIYW